jgi:hypothetical protein
MLGPFAMVRVHPPAGPRDPGVSAPAATQPPAGARAAPPSGTPGNADRPATLEKPRLEKPRPEKRGLEKHGFEERRGARRAWRRAIGAGAILVVVLAGPAGAQQPAGAKVLVLAAEPADPRIEATRSAIAFWNRTFEELGLAPVFGEPEVVVASPATRDLENYAWQISRSAGRLAAGSLEPAPPPFLRSTDAGVGDLEAGIIVLLSVQKLMPFAWPLATAPLAPSRRYFVALANEPAATPDATHRVIVHELGHALGLDHDPTKASVLMCMPCSHAPAQEPPGAIALTPAERSRLLELYADR